MFAQPIPSFNVKGEETIKTNLGGAVSVMIAVLVLLYSVHKFGGLYNRSSPAIASYPIDTVVDEKNPIDLNASKLMPAFSFGTWGYDYESEEHTFETKFDPRYVKLVVQAYGEYDFREFSNRQIPYHKCTSEDLAAYNPLQTTIEEGDVAKIIRGGGFYCLDWDDADPLLLYGYAGNAEGLKWLGL